MRLNEEVITMNKTFIKIVKKFFLILPFSIILPIAQIDWVVRKILEFYETLQEINAFKRPETCPMNFKHYLSDTEERIERLRKLINKRPVAIILPGFSARELEQRIRELKDCDICYSGVNSFSVIEKYVLQKINRNLSIAMCIAYPEAKMDSIIDFLERQEDNIFISEKVSFKKKSFRLVQKNFHLDKFIKKYDEKLLFFNSVVIPFILTMKGRLFPKIPNREHPLHLRSQGSLSSLLCLILIGGASRVVIFGGDGGRINNEELYFRYINPPKTSISQSGINPYMIDTKAFNATMPLILKRIYKLYNLKPVDIINCSERSHYTPFRKVSYDEAFVLLKH